MDKGITLRDWFAGQAAAALASAHDNAGLWTGLIGDEPSCRIIADYSYALADAMLARRAA